jgi:hypothetical protein
MRKGKIKVIRFRVTDIPTIRHFKGITGVEQF